MDRMWYYAPAGSERQGPVSEAQLKDLLARGQLAPSDLVWSEGMASWVAASTVPELGATPAGHVLIPAGASAAATAQVPDGLGTWLTFVGVINILSGALSCLSCFALPVGILMILAGFACLRARTALEALEGIDPALLPALQKIKTYFLMSGWVFILNLVLVGLILLMFAGIAVPMISKFQQAMP